MRVIDAFEFCLTNKHPRTTSGLGDKKDYLGVETPTGTANFDGIDRVFAAIGISPEKPPARRPGLPVFESPQPLESRAEDQPQPPEPAVYPREKEPAAPSTSLEKLPYPFTGHKSQVSSQDPIPFPPSPEPDVDTEAVTSEGVDEEEGEGEHSNDVESSEVTTDERRTSGSMSSLGRPIASRYPFSFRRPMSGRGSLSSNSHVSPYSHLTHSTLSRSGRSHSTHPSMSTQSTGNRESSDSPMSYPSSANASPTALTASVIPMPPRHPHRRSRAGTVPMSSPSSQSSIPSAVFPGRGQPRPRADSALTRADSDLSMTFGQPPMPFVLDSEDEEGPMHDDSLMDVPEVEASVEEAEQHDSVGLLAAGSSPRASRTSLRQFTSGLQRRANGSRSRSGTTSRSRTNSSNSRSESARSRAQSLMHSIGAASRSSVDLVVRSRASSAARLSDSPYYSTSPDPMPSSPENNTFGHPRRQRRTDVVDDDHDVSDIAELPERTSSDVESMLGGELRTSLTAPRQRLASELSRVAPSERSGQTERPLDLPASPTTPATPSSPAVPVTPTSPVPIPGREVHTEQSMPAIPTADQSYVTAPATIQGTTDSSGRTPGTSWSASQGRFPPPPSGPTWEPA